MSFVELPPAIQLAEHAIAIRMLGKKTISNIAEIGRSLSEAKEIAGHGNWLPWLKKEFGWTDDTALNYMRVYEMDKNRTVRDLNLPLRTLYLLAAPGTPPEVRDDLIDRLERGEVTPIEAKEILRPPVLPRPAELLSPEMKTMIAAAEERVMMAAARAPLSEAAVSIQPSPASDGQVRYFIELAASQEASRTADKYLSAQSERLGPVAPPPKIDGKLATLLKRKRATLRSWINQHKNDDIPEILAAL